MRMLFDPTAAGQKYLLSQQSGGISLFAKRSTLLVQVTLALRLAAMQAPWLPPPLWAPLPLPPQAPHHMWGACTGAEIHVATLLHGLDSTRKHSAITCNLIMRPLFGCSGCTRARRARWRPAWRRGRRSAGGDQRLVICAARAVARGGCRRRGRRCEAEIRCGWA